VNQTGSGEEVKELKEKPDGLKGIQLYIDPDVCIVCGACLPECPVNAIYGSEEEVPENERESIRKNYEFFGQEVPPEYA
jgi:NAD-dependent dihydropyrimidine dehydrogenase PreA subunit